MLYHIEPVRLWLGNCLYVSFISYHLAVTSNYTYVWESLGFTSGLVVKNMPANTGGKSDTGLITELGRSPGVWKGNPLQYFCLENFMDRGVWWAAVHGVTESQTWLNMSMREWGLGFMVHIQENYARKPMDQCWSRTIAYWVPFFKQVAHGWPSVDHQFSGGGIGLRVQNQDRNRRS